jgi:hypothetical protein
LSQLELIDEDRVQITDIEWTGFFPDGMQAPDSNELI